MAFVPPFLSPSSLPRSSYASCSSLYPIHPPSTARTHVSRRTRMVAPTQSTPPKSPAFSTLGLTVADFFQRSLGTWRSQRSSHNLAWTQFEAVTSEILIASLPADHPDVVALCARYSVPVEDVLVSVRMSWEGESDWNDDEVMQGEAVMSVVEDGEGSGRLLRSVGYAETVPAVGEWQMTREGVFVLRTTYEAAAAEERIWFATPHLRMRVSQIRTSSGEGVVTASFSTEIRRLDLP